MIYSDHLTRLLFFVAVGTLTACATPQPFQSEAPGSNSAEVLVRFNVSSSRDAILGGVFEDGRQCRNYRPTNVSARKTPAYEMRVKPETLSMLFMSWESTGYLEATMCSGTWSFEPKAGSRYEVVFHDAPKRCGVSLAELVDGVRSNLNDKLVKRDALAKMPGISRCADLYVPK